MGFSTGVLYLCLFGTYALAFWYGAVLIMETGGYTIGVVLTVFFSVIIGAFGIAQVRFLEPNSNSDLKRLGSVQNLKVNVCKTERSNKRILDVRRASPTRDSELIQTLFWTKM